MSIVGPWLNDIGSAPGKGKGKISKAKQLEFERGWRERNQRLKEMSLPKESFEQYMRFVYGHKAQETRKAPIRPQTSMPTNKVFQILERTSIPSNANTEGSTHKSKPWITGPCSSKPSPIYTGKNVVGISVMHKSCLQPVFSQEAAIDAAKMRR